MKETPVDTPATEPRFTSDRHDTVLALALGSLSFEQRFEEMVRRATSPVAQALDIDDPVVLAALGVVSVGRSLRRWLEHAAASAAPAKPDGTSAHAPVARDLLR
jgi:hypothetical protein